ncbi:retrovirus-related pol polyprotein from transposon TNT 1-94 [Tanacetum coccineum]
MGPSQVESLGGKRYFLSIVDDYSRRVCVYILRFNEKFKEWKQLVENQTGTTEQNGVAERMNSTLMDKVRCLLRPSGQKRHVRPHILSIGHHREQ